MNICHLETRILLLKSCQTAVEGMLFLAQSIWQLSPIMLTGTRHYYTY